MNIIYIYFKKYRISYCTYKQYIRYILCVHIYICINRFLRFFHVILRILGQCLALSKTASKSLQIEQPGWVGSRPPARDAEDARPTMGTCLAIICSAKWETVSHIISVYNICHIYNLEKNWFSGKWVGKIPIAFAEVHYGSLPLP